MYSNYFNRIIRAILNIPEPEVQDLREKVKEIERVAMRCYIDPLAEKMNNKYPKAEITYNVRRAPGSTKLINFDIRNFIQTKNFIIEKIIDDYKLKGSNHDETAYNVWKWVVTHIKYITDIRHYQTDEYWDFPDEVLASREGDCEDMTNLMVSMARIAGVPAFRIKNCVSMADFGDNKRKGAHSYAIYLRQTDDEWVILEPTIPQVSVKSVAELCLAKEDKRYFDIFFTFNDEFCWYQKTFSAEAHPMVKDINVKPI